MVYVLNTTLNTLSTRVVFCCSIHSFHKIKTVINPIVMIPGEHVSVMKKWWVSPVNTLVYNKQWDGKILFQDVWVSPVTPVF